MYHVLTFGRKLNNEGFDLITLIESFVKKDLQKLLS